jgi:peroxiredoxin
MKTDSVSTRLRTLLPAVVLCATAFLTASSWTAARADAPLQTSESSKPTLAPKAQEVGDFSLLDQKGRFHELRRVDGARAVVLMIAGNGCPVVRQNAAKLKALRDKFPQVQFLMLNANPQDDRASILEESNEFGFGVPVLKDETQMVASSLGVKRTAEVLAISAKDWTVFYRGALDDQMVQGAVKAAVREPYLENALRAFLDGKEVAPASTVAAGCLVHYDFTSSNQVSYARHVAPILESKCVSCHSAGNIGPFAMSSYSKVKGFSDQIREEILTQRMPPWSADRHFGVFQGDRSLAPAEAQTLLRWIDAGAPRGEGEDRLAALAQTQSKPDAWVLGKPDYVVTPSHRMEIPATGVVDYITNIVDCPIPTDAWLKGAVVRPDNKKVVHHVIVYLEYPEGYPGANSWEEKWLTSWSPGRAPTLFPGGTGKFIPKGTKLRFQLHYTPYGKEAADLTEIGMYLHQQPPSTELRKTGAANRDFTIPAQASNHSTLAVLNFPKDTILYDLSPHMHKRGSWFRYEALYPDGKYEVLLSVPRYNFNWQQSYRFAQPKHVPAGTRILCTGGFDNSSFNPDNPDPTQSVHWGDQSFEEMFIGFLTASDVAPRAAVGSP